MKFRLVPVAVLVSITLTACNFSLAEDITPPPGYLSPTPPPTVGPLYPAQPPSPARGEAIYLAKCQPCHGDTGLGNGPLATQMPVSVPAVGLRDISSQFSPADWFTLVSQGDLQRGMPPFQSLSNQERWDVLAYIYSMSLTGDELQRGEAVYIQNCAACHGSEGRGDGPRAAGLNPAPKNIADPRYISLVTDTALYRSVAGGYPPGMQAFSGQLSDSDIWAVVAYLRSMNFDLSAQSAALQPSATSFLPTATPALQGTPPPEETGTPAVTPPVGTPAATVPSANLTGTPVVLATVKGTVTNGSGTPLAAGLSATLHGFTGQSETLTLEAPVGADGAYVFNDVPLTSGIGFLVVVKYDSVDYTSAGVMFDGKTTAFDQPVTIYDTTADLNALSLDQFHVIVDFSTKGLIQIYEIYVVSVPGEAAVVLPSDGHSLPFVKVPEAAVQASLSPAQGSAPLSFAVGGYALLPGSSQYSFISSFALSYDNNTAKLVQPFVLPAKAAAVLVPEGVLIASDQLADQGTSTVQGAVYRQYSGGDIAAGSSLSMTISGTPSSSSTGSSILAPSSGLVIGVGAFGLVLIAAGITLFLRDRRQKERESSGRSQPVGKDALGEDPESITDAILLLDDQYKAGKIPKEAYQQRRAELKARLKELI